MEQFGKILVMAFLVVSLYDIIKSFKKGNKINFDAIITAVLGIILSVLASLDIFALLNITFAVPYVGCVLTGFVISKGANYVFDFITNIISLLSGRVENK